MTPEHLKEPPPCAVCGGPTKWGKCVKCDNATPEPRGRKHTDGTWVRVNQADTEAEDAIAAQLAPAWNCTLHRFAALHPIDFYAVRHGRMVAVVECRVRSHASGMYPTVFLAVRKYTVLYESAWLMNVRAFFVVQFTDGIRYIDVTRIDATKHTIDGRRDGSSMSSREPVILVSVADMVQLKVAEGDAK